MSDDAPLAEFEFRGGALRGSRFTLFPGRLVHRGGDVSESVALAQLGAVRIAFERDARKLNDSIEPARVVVRERVTVALLVVADRVGTQ